MATSPQQVFSIPELAAQVALRLTTSDISRLSRTNRALHSHCSPVLFKTITYFILSKIFVSGPSTQTFGRNARHVKDLTLRSDELAYYYNCVKAFEEFLAQTSDNTPRQRPKWCPPPDPRTCQIVALPPMTRLSNLELHFVDPRTSPVKVPSADDPRAILAQLCWLISLNPQLKSLAVHYIPLKAGSNYQLFLRTITQLKELEKLDILLECSDKRGFQQGQELFNCLHPSIKSFSFRHYQLTYDDDPSESQDGCGEKVDGDGSSGDVAKAVPRRDGPLPKVLELKLWKISNETPLTDIVPIFAQCPNLTELDISGITGYHDVEAIGNSIGKECPKIHTLRYYPDNVDTNDLLPYWIAAALPPQQLIAFKDMGIFADLDYPPTSLAIQRHSTTLQAITLGRSNGGYSRLSPGVIFDNCINLEILNMSIESSGVFIDLQDAQGDPWRCIKLQELVVVIRGCELPEGDADKGEEDIPNLPYYARPCPITLSAAETHHFSRLENLYKQLGRLTELTYLDITMIKLDEDGEVDETAWPWGDMILTVPPSFPAMMSLGSTWEGRPGYLHHLAGLSKLELFTGSIRADTEENEATMEFKECVWIDQHWPRLARADFFRYKEDIKTPFKWLKDQRKNGRGELQLSWASD
ncbi:hypothetical protein EC991_008080 [Linnemannia zychae]|nr:hypothetical protein EC991_008080 [Linnemannia zychae]